MVLDIYTFKGGSMLPFLSPKKMTGIIMAKYKPEGKTEPMHEEGEMHPGLMAAAEALISAVHAKDAKAVAQAMQDADMIMDAGEEME
jgi:hypothetical protein